MYFIDTFGVGDKLGRTVWQTGIIIYIVDNVLFQGEVMKACTVYL